MNDKHQRSELYIEGGEERDGVVKRGSMKEMVLSKLFKHEENLAKGIGLSSLEEQLQHKQGSGKHEGMLDTMNGPFLLALGFGEVCWGSSEVVSKNAFGL